MERDPNALLLTQLQAAKLLGRNTRIIRRWTRAGLLPTFTDPTDGATLYPKAALERWAANASEMQRKAS